MDLLKKIKHKTIRKAEEAFNFFLNRSKLRKHEILPGKRLILCYHGIDLKGSTKFNSKFISRNNLEKQIIYFKKYFNVIPLEKMINPEEVDPLRFSLSITFDDGYKNNLKYALPLLEKYQIPATFFITGIRERGEEILPGDFLDIASHLTNITLKVDGQVYKKNVKRQYSRLDDGVLLKTIFHESNFDFKKRIMDSFPYSVLAFRTNPAYDDYWQLMDEDDIQLLARSKYASVGLHGYDHTDLSRMTIPEALDNIKKSKNYLENTIRKEVQDLAFPYGRYTDELVDECEKKGLRSVLSLQYLTNKRGSILHDRFGINPYIQWDNQLHYILKGSYS